MFKRLNTDTITLVIPICLNILSVRPDIDSVLLCDNCTDSTRANQEMRYRNVT